MQPNVHFTPQVIQIHVIQGNVTALWVENIIFPLIYSLEAVSQQSKTSQHFKPFSRHLLLHHISLSKSPLDWTTPPKNIPRPCQIMTRIPKHEFLISPPKRFNISGFSFWRCWPFTEWFSLQDRDDELRDTITSLPSSPTSCLCGGWVGVVQDVFVSGNKRMMKLQTPHHISATLQSSCSK